MLQAQGKEHIVWLDTVRLVTMFTVVCCHSADPFNFYTGGSTDDLEAIKFWGAAWGAASIWHTTSSQARAWP